MSDKLSPDDLLDHVKESVVSIGQGFTAPDEDWTSTLFILDPENKLTLVSIMVGTTLEACAAIMGIMRECEAQAIVLVQSVWRAWGPPVIDPTSGRRLEVKDMPGREEAVVLFAGTRDGGRNVYTARIVRSTDKPPTLEPWVQDTEFNAIEGEIPRAVTLGFGGQL